MFQIQIRFMIFVVNARKFDAMKHKMETRLNEKPTYFAMFLINFYHYLSLNLFIFNVLHGDNITTYLHNVCFLISLRNNSTN